MKKIISVLCILAVCFSAEAQKKTTSSTSAAKSTSSGVSSGSSSSARPKASVGHKAGSLAITADMSFFSETLTTTQTGGGQTINTITKDPFGNGTIFGIGAGVRYFINKNIEVGGDIGYQTVTTILGQDVNGDDLHQVVSLFSLTPSVGFHIPICHWLDYVPEAFILAAFGNNMQEQQINPLTTVTGSASEFEIGVNPVRFEILCSKSVSLILSTGRISYDVQTRNLGGQNNQNTRKLATVSMNLFANPTVGVRYYIK